MGTSVMPTMSEMSCAKVTVSAWSRNSCPAMPLTNTIGKNTATEVSVEAVTAVATSAVPSRAASMVDSPASLRRAMASRMTTELSINMPTESAMPPSDITFSVRSKAYIITKMPTTVTGITMPVTIVAHASRRKKYSTRIESRPPRIAASFTSLTALAMNLDWS